MVTLQPLMTIRFCDIAAHLGPRFEGATIRNLIIPAMQNGATVTFDFEGVKTVSNSFADECFAMLLLHFDLRTIKARTTFINTSPFIKSVISNSFSERVTRLTQATTA